ncbi:ER membrane protein complex subunit 3 [Hondaea fermentalgiana]|uniref:ER membrane protein complex subunit 3 n=1 Tax=Hondaea fermentalgiana TaxID=2315210 RepID=A0A2R5GQ45_9STRA|nr:ER membrane protein complex subunit 3 [Hondaea fermentalgiana]|eukprot:GBG32987.1 ER membrane protein complex subunit 3 [Hondaea fermentalgiana]
MDADLMLDPKIRNWVLIPILIIMLLVQMSRSWAQVLLKGSTPPEPGQFKQMQLLQRATRLRANNRLLSSRGFHMRRHFLVELKGIGLRQKFEGSAPNPMQNPDGMMNMMKGNMTMMVPNIAMMTFISFFFQGFVMVKVPFMLTEGFKQMLQRDISLQTLDTSYVSSLSWYFLALFGLRGFFSLVLGDQAVTDDAKIMQQQMGMGGGNPMQFDANKSYKQMREGVKHIQHQFFLGELEEEFMMLPAKKKTA